MSAGFIVFRTIAIIFFVIAACCGLLLYVLRRERTGGFHAAYALEWNVGLALGLSCSLGSGALCWMQAALS